jgi:hypothetical protein
MPIKTIDTAQALSMVEQGLTYDEIALKFGVARSTVLAKLDEFDASAHLRARTISAESWLDRGLEPLQQALDKGSNIDAAAARAYEQACARRAALRNPAYRDSNKTELTGPNGGAIQIARIERVIVGSQTT